MTAEACTVLGVDVSTRRVAFAELSLDAVPIRLGTVELGRGLVHERLTELRRLAPRGAFYDQVAHVAIEMPFHHARSRGYLELVAAVGVVAAHVPLGADVWMPRPQEWRRALGWPANERRELTKARARRYALDELGPAPIAFSFGWCAWQGEHDGEDDVAEALAIARAALAELYRAADHEFERAAV